MSRRQPFEGTYMDSKVQELELDKMTTNSDSDSTISLGSHAEQLDEILDIEKIATSNTTRSKHGSPATRAITAQDWTGPDDPENPWNWPLWKRIYHTTVVGMFCFTVTFASSAYTPGIFDTAKHFNVSTEAAILPLTLYVLGLAFGPIVSAPLSETFGRKLAYLSTIPISLLFTLGAGFSQNFGSLLVCRFFAGAFGAGCLAIGAGTNSDLWPPISRAAASAVFLLAPFLGPAIGPPVGGFAVMAKGWRWTQWPVLMIGLFALVFGALQKETYKKIILQKRAKKFGLPPPPNPLPPGLARIKVLLFVTVLRPIRMLVTEPIVACFSMYTAFNFAVLFAFFDAFPIVFQGVYHFNTGESGLTFLGIGFGCCIATGVFIMMDRLTYRKKTLAARARGDMSQLPPEQRLHSAMLGSFLLPIGLFWFAWTAREEIHWIVPLLATVPFGVGNMLVFCSCVLYIIDVYGSLAGASAAAANGMSRYVLGAVFPLFTIQMYHKLGINWATSLLGFVTIALLPIPWVLYKFGPRIRARSGYAVAK